MSKRKLTMKMLRRLHRQIHVDHVVPDARRSLKHWARGVAVHFLEYDPVGKAESILRGHR